MTSISLSRFIIKSQDTDSEAESQFDNGRIVIVWEKAAQDLNRQQCLQVK